MALLHLRYLTRPQTQARCNVLLFSTLATKSRTQKKYWEIGNNKLRSWRELPVALSIYIHFGLDLSVNVILGLSLGVHPHVSSPHTTVSGFLYTILCCGVFFIHWPKKI